MTTPMEASEREALLETPQPCFLRKHEAACRHRPGRRAGPPASMGIELLTETQYRNPNMKGHCLCGYYTFANETPMLTEQQVIEQYGAPGEQSAG